MGSPKGGNNNFLTRCSATPKEISNLTEVALSVYMMPLPDLHDEKQVQDAIVGYFNTCIQHGTKPGNLGLYAALGMSRQDYNNAVTGKSKSKVSPACIDLIKKAARAIGVYREGLALENKIHPTTYIFMGKNYDQLEDYTRLEISADRGPAANLSPDEIQKQLERDIPIEVDSTETD